MTDRHSLLQVTALLVMYGLPRLLTGSILAHECMHAWFVLNYIDCSNKTVNEGLSQLMALIWVEAQKSQVCCRHIGLTSLLSAVYCVICSVLGVDIQSLQQKDACCSWKEHAFLSGMHESPMHAAQTIC